MPVRLERDSADFDQRFAAFLAAKREISADVEVAARAIVDDVAKRGDAALLEATRKFDRLHLKPDTLRISAMIFGESGANMVSTINTPCLPTCTVMLPPGPTNI